ncbi:MAG: DoxX family protein [Flavisolibacter sp.]|nr:DoxX family protein [Flavisolibacter sp.]
MAQAITNEKTSADQPAWLTFLRVALGIILIWKGINFIRDTSALKALIEQTGVGLFTQNAGALALVVTILTLLCGFFITAGLFTRIASVVQIPIILVAIVFVIMKNIERNGFELVLTVVVLLLLVLFALKGSGALSADEYFRRGAAADKDSDRMFR